MVYKPLSPVVTYRRWREAPRERHQSASPEVPMQLPPVADATQHRIVRERVPGESID
jgi:hypothetical protein